MEGGRTRVSMAREGRTAGWRTAIYEGETRAPQAQQPRDSTWCIVEVIASSSAPHSLLLLLLLSSSSSFLLLPVTQRRYSIIFKRNRCSISQFPNLRLIKPRRYKRGDKLVHHCLLVSKDPPLSLDKEGERGWGGLFLPAIAHDWARWWPSTDERDRSEDCRTCPRGEARVVGSKEKECVWCAETCEFVSRGGWARVGKVRGSKSYFSFHFLKSSRVKKKKKILYYYVISVLSIFFVRNFSCHLLYIFSINKLFDEQ